MVRTKWILRWTGILCALAVILIGAVGADGLKTALKQPSTDARVDFILIDAMARFGELDKPPVPFPHDLHTEALAKEKKDCFFCHLKESKPQALTANPELQSQPVERMSIKFKRLKDTTEKEVRRIYHDNCMGCHLSMAEKGEKFGPVACGECHMAKLPDRSSRRPMGHDLSLHYRHSKAAQDKCGLCHHEYDEKAKTLFYAKEKEGTCRYCHTGKTEENRASMAVVSHLSCVECHRLEKEKNVESGPITCKGCHDIKDQQKIKKVEPLPRMDRKQPDLVFVKTLRQGEQGEITRMHPVPFDHKAHEGFNNTCRGCHHDSMKACNECHALGKPLKEGHDVKLERAMHQTSSEKSCVGCHQVGQHAKECAGCHVFITRGQEEQGASCLKCHMKPLMDSKVLPQTKEGEKKMVEDLLQSRQTVKGTYPQEEIPEKVIIKDLMDKYEPVELPHRKIALSLVNGINGSRQSAQLAAYFHEGQDTVCQGCHHYSPASPKPPRCLNCHGKPFDEVSLLKPGILGAYHQQCMGCHAAMEIQKPKECVDCHKEKNR